ncbi:MAG: S24/S26 family peptidase [Clostridia bacterium]|nr:S24/S26 family peptidase [Clostridia bacterium]
MNKSIRFEEIIPLIREEIQKGNSFSFTAFGSSMHPYIRGGKDKVCLSPLTSPPKEGDVVFYQRENGAFVLHRIIKIKNGQYIMCGDNQFSREFGIRAEQIIARLSFVERNGKAIRPSSFSSQCYRFFLPLRRFLLHLRYALKKLLS